MKTSLLLSALAAGCVTAFAQTAPTPAPTLTPPADTLSPLRGEGQRPDRLDPIRFREKGVSPRKTDFS